MPSPILGPDGQPIRVLPSAQNAYQETLQRLGEHAMFLCRGSGPLSGILSELKSTQAEVQAIMLCLANTIVMGPEGAPVRLLDPDNLNTMIIRFLGEAERELAQNVEQIKQAFVQAQEHMAADAANLQDIKEKANESEPETSQDPGSDSPA